MRLSPSRLAYLVMTVLILGSFSLSAEPRRSCPANTIKKNQIDSIIERRQTTFKHCLSCSDDVCELKTWPETAKDFSAACQLLFCTPTKQPKSLFLPERVASKGGIHFSYGISKEGRIKDVEVLDLIGEVTEPMARKLITSMFERRRYEPIIIDGKAYELTNLEDGTNFKVKTTVRAN